MRKDQLVRTLARTAKAKASKTSRLAAPSAAKTARRSPATAGARGKSNSPASSNGRAAAKAKNTRIVRKIHAAHEQRERAKDLAGPESTGHRPSQNGQSHKQVNGHSETKDRIVLMVRDSYWLHACWDITRQNVMRAKAAMAEQWHTAKPILRLMQVELGSTTSTAERLVRDIEIHGGVKNWYIDIQQPPRSYRVDIGYRAANGRFYALSRSNIVSTPEPGSYDSLDENWRDIAEDYERVFALSGGYSGDGDSSDLQELFEERLRRPMGVHAVGRFGNGAQRMLGRARPFVFEVDAEMIIFGRSQTDAHVTLGGEPVKLREDGTFTVRLKMPERRQVLPVVASSPDGVEQRTVVLAVERNTKVMEPLTSDHHE